MTGECHSSRSADRTRNRDSLGDVACVPDRDFACTADPQDLKCPTRSAPIGNFYSTATCVHDCQLRDLCLDCMESADAAVPAEHEGRGHDVGPRSLPADDRGT